MAEIRGGRDLDRELSELGRRLARPGVLKVGFLAGATYPDGTPVALVAAVNNWGAPSKGIPPTSFFSNMVETHKGEWGPALGALLAQTGDVEKSLNLLGEGITGQLRQAIRDIPGPPNAPSTIKRKGFDKRGTDSGHMLNSADYKVDL